MYEDDDERTLYDDIGCFLFDKENWSLRAGCQMVGEYGEGERILFMDHAFEKRKKVVYDFICDDLYVPMKQKEIAMVLQVPKELREELREVLDALEGEGKVHLSKRGKYTRGAAKRLTGTFQAHARGFGFVVCPEREGDVYISEENVGGAFHGDEVEFVVTRERQGNGQRTEGKIVNVLSRGTTHVVGLYESCGKHTNPDSRRSKLASRSGVENTSTYGFVHPDNQRFFKDVYIPAGKDKGAMTGHKVVVELTSYGGPHEKPEGIVTEILGHVNDPGTDILSIVKGYDLPLQFPERVLNQAERVAKDVCEADMAGRLDLRDWRMVTIDGEDAKDLDDAVSLDMKGENYVLGVHIADVTNYVQENSALDREALKRGTSVYLVDRVIPMLPHKLSNGICSLNAGEDRLALSCIMTVAPDGEMLDHQIAETVIRVDKRMSYTGVAHVLEHGARVSGDGAGVADVDAGRKARVLPSDEHGAGEDAGEYADYAPFVPTLRRMADLSRILRERRKQRGSIDFEFPESKIILDEKGKPLEIKAYERNAATKLIEDFMLLANETVAEEYFWRELPFLYRTHDTPDEEKMRRLCALINNFGYHIHVKNEVHPKEVQKLLAKAEGTPEETLISRLALRSMKQARYTPENSGHFGLAAKYYTHFTSPIRRYPDLQIHRIIKENLRGRLTEGRIGHYERLLPKVAVRSSELERRAEEAERDTEKLKKVEYMQGHVGEEYDGVISGVTKWGAYVELPNTVEGLVHVANMEDDHYDYDEAAYELRGEHTGKNYKLGQKVRVQVLDVDKLQRTVDFIFI